MISMKISEIKVKSRFRQGLGNLTGLVNSIKDIGLLHPIGVSKDNQLIFGERRLEACKKLGWKDIPAQILDYDDITRELAEHLENLHREDLPWDLQVKSIRRVVELYEARGLLPKHGGDRARDNSWLLTQTKLASELLGISLSTMKDALQLADAIEADPELKKEKSKTKALKKHRKKKKKKEREETIKKTQIQLPETVKLYNDEFQNLNVKELPNNSIALIITDPPYGNEYLRLYKDLAQTAKRVLRDGGSLLCYTGQFNLPEKLRLLASSGLNYRWLMAVIHAGPTSIVNGSSVIAHYKPMAWFIKGKYNGDVINDLITSEFQGKEYHEWAQSTKESDYYIKMLTIEKDIVYDPMMGQGTFGISAKNLNRQFIGCELNEEYFRIAEKLLSD